ncbi:MAG TPA: aldose epimerase family protein [Ramlibacter sp.]|jgi:aldose 1-epimerase|uniref:aldose epimerase family protein n=1 Tax=Ramlibacter sp. TaxID=1917967 RepID=UPI002D2A778B|nr:aldose epimerase family protein [Ramlibacter sp.]HZY18104.1 aldose epimerase family protein [Ramlibacter sp.]
MTHPAPLDPAAFAGPGQGRPIRLLMLQSPGGLRAAVCTHGARLLQLVVPGRGGDWHDVVLGHDSLAQLRAGLPSMGAIVGRYANRIAHARFVLDGRTWTLPPNDGPHCLHGGPAGSRHQVFEVLSQSAEHALLRWTFHPEEDGFPGTLRLDVSYRLRDPGELAIGWRAQALDAPTVLNVTAHPYFNLEGQSSPHARGHCIAIACDHVLPVDPGRIPTGELLPVDGTPWDLREGPDLASALARLARGAPDTRGFDHCWVATLQPRPGVLRRLARAVAPATGIVLEAWSDAPGLQFFTASGLDGSAPRHCGKGGRRYGPEAGFCLEPQQLPDAPNQPAFPPTRLEAGEQRQGEIAYRFSVEGPAAA